MNCRSAECQVRHTWNLCGLQILSQISAKNSPSFDSHQSTPRSWSPASPKPALGLKFQYKVANIRKRYQKDSHLNHLMILWQSRHCPKIWCPVLRPRLEGLWVRPVKCGLPCLIDLSPETNYISHGYKNDIKWPKNHFKKIKCKKCQKKCQNKCQNLLGLDKLRPETHRTVPAFSAAAWATSTERVKTWRSYWKKSPIDTASLGLSENRVAQNFGSSFYTSKSTIFGHPLFSDTSTWNSEHFIIFDLTNPCPPVQPVQTTTAPLS